MAESRAIAAALRSVVMVLKGIGGDREVFALKEPTG
jgi:hypothetical protein